MEALHQRHNGEISELDFETVRGDQARCVSELLILIPEVFPVGDVHAGK